MFWHILLGIAFAAVFWLTINILILNVMENWLRLAVHFVWADFMSRTIEAAIGWALAEIDP